MQCLYGRPAAVAAGYGEGEARMGGSHESTTADATLVVRFSELLSRTQWALYDFVRGLVGEPQLARDLTQDTFVAAWRVAKRVAPPFTDLTDEIGIRRWLFTIACRHAAMPPCRCAAAESSLGNRSMT